MAMPNGLYLSMSKHCTERFIQRFSKLFKPEQISSPELVRSLAIHCIHQSSEIKNWLNNTNFTTDLYEKYGYDRKYHIFNWNEKIKFICVEDGNRLVALTCVKMI